MIKNLITPSVDYFCRLKLLDRQNNEPTNQNLVKIPKVVEPTNKKILSNNFEDKCNKLPNVPSHPANNGLK